MYVYAGCVYFSSHFGMKHVHTTALNSQTRSTKKSDASSTCSIPPHSGDDTVSHVLLIGVPWVVLAACYTTLQARDAILVVSAPFRETSRMPKATRTGCACTINQRLTNAAIGCRMPKGLRPLLVTAVSGVKLLTSPTKPIRKTN